MFSSHPSSELLLLLPFSSLRVCLDGFCSVGYYRTLCLSHSCGSSAPQDEASLQLVLKLSSPGRALLSSKLPFCAAALVPAIPQGSGPLRCLPAATGAELCGQQALHRAPLTGLSLLQWFLLMAWNLVQDLVYLSSWSASHGPGCQCSES